MSLSNACLKHL